MVRVLAVDRVIDFIVLSLVYSRSLASEPEVESAAVEPVPRRLVHRGLLIKCLCVTAGMIALFFAGQSIAITALAAAAILMLDRVRIEKIYSLVDWPLLVMFVGLFVVVHAFEIHVIRGFNLQECTALKSSPVLLLSGLSVVLSNIVSNVPAVLLFKPLIEAIPDKRTAWLALAMSSTLAGNLTMLGSVANLIVVESARRDRVDLGFGEFLKIGVPLTILTTLVGIAWLMMTHY